MNFSTRQFFVVGVILTISTTTIAEQPGVRTDVDLECLLAEKAGLDLDLPALGYSWSDSGLSVAEESGSLTVTATKVIYYFLHWGPPEAVEITEEYVRARIPQVWPDEGLSVRSVGGATVCGHPAMFAEVVPRRDFYRAFFTIWNCPESGRQFIADMNYNVQYFTPCEELEAEFAVTNQTLACHPGAKTETVPGHVARYESSRFGLAFDHPLHWFVNESPYSVPHPEYRGIRSDRLGSLLANLQDSSVDIVFRWETLPDETGDEQSYMGSSVAHYRAAILGARGLEGVESFEYDDAETVSIGGRRVFKLFGDVAGKVTGGSGTGPRMRAMTLVVDDRSGKRRLQVVFLIDEHKVGGESRRPVRDIFDRWALSVVEGLNF